ncbi:LysR family transcriptional regulator [Aquabacterium sp. A7-Y]|uniref:LysR family transcriptional regulator n=1 Tax=Aquabacterium sp. A7-Y TaxID=1349605 RepID=UPI00223E40CA|nr:LysR family transcriptional regulator [Aquabacterium sp. A7-Y]MCW7537994.1 LysR family transcriptional regulator [Aquabacterium sp. A7-Y]
MKTLLDVVEAGSFAAAARERQVPPNTLSRQVQRLERDLGIRLLQRTTRSLGLTSSGRELVTGARVALAQLEQQLQEVSSQAKEPRGHLRVTVPSDFFSLGLADRMAHFMEEHPGISLEFLLSDEQVDLIESGVDLAVRAGVVRDANLVARQLTESRLIVVASPACIARHGAPRTPKALAAYPCLASRGRNGYATWQLAGPRGTASVPVRAKLTANGMGALIAAAKAGLGAALVPRALVQASLADGTLVQLMDRYHGFSPGVFAVYPSRLHQSAALKKLVAFLVEEAAKLAR